MKHLILASMLTFSSLAVHAEAISAAFGTTATAMTAMEIMACDWGSSQECKAYRLLMSASAVSAIVAILKEDIAQIQPDAHNFLAGEEISLALEEQMNAARALSSEAAALSDEDLAIAMIQIANM